MNEDIKIKSNKKLAPAQQNKIKRGEIRNKFITKEIRNKTK
jgi:hypothetical protein